MKKIVNMVLALACVFTLTACAGNSADEGGKDSSNNGAVTENNKDEKNYTFKYNDTDIAVNMEADKLLNEIGNEQSYFEAPSCAFDGIDKIYTYGGFELHTYPASDKKEYVSAVIFKDDSVKTEEGIYIGDTREKVVETYGEDFEDVDGAYVYDKGEGKLQFIFKNDLVASVEYIATVSK